MKKFLFTLALVLLVSVSARAQQPQARRVFATTSVAADAWILETGSGVQFHQLTWNASGVVGTCQVELDFSADGITSSGTIIATQLCTSNGLSTLSAATIANYVRINVTTKSGAGSVTVTYLGYTSLPLGGGGTITGKFTVQSTNPCPLSSVLTLTACGSGTDPFGDGGNHGPIEIVQTSTTPPNGCGLVMSNANSVGNTGTSRPIYACFDQTTLGGFAVGQVFPSGATGGFDFQGTGSNQGSANFGTNEADGVAVEFGTGPVLGSLSAADAGVFLDDGGHFCFIPTGATGTGKLCIGTQNAAGTPNPVEFPTTTGAAGTFLQTNGGNPQHTVWAAVGVAANTPGIPTYNGPNIVYAANYGVKAQGVRFFDASFTINTKNVTVGNNTSDSDACVTSAMIGWLFHGSNGPATTPALTATALFAAGTTIATVASCTSFTVSNNASATCTSSVANSLCQVVIAPNDDQAALLAAFQQVMPATGSTNCGGTLVLPQGIMWISAPISYASKCNSNQKANGSSSGIWVVGQGQTATTIFPAPGTWTTGVNQAAFFFNTTSNSGVHFSDFTIDGAGQNVSLSAQGFSLALGQNSSASYVSVYQFGLNGGILCSGGDAAEATADHVFIGLANSVTGNVVAGSYCRITNSAFFWSHGTGNAQFQGTPVWSTNNTYDLPKAGENILLSSGEAWSVGDTIVANFTNTPAVFVSGGSVLHVASAKVFNPQPGTNPVAFNTDNTPSKLFIRDTTVLYNANSGKLFVNNGVVNDLGGNTYQSAVADTGTGTYNKSPETVGSDTQVAKAAAQAAKTVFTVGNATTFFRVHLSVECTTTSAAATVTPSVVYTDTSNTVQTITGTVATCTALGAASNTSQDVTFRALTATVIQYSTAIVNTPTYDINVTVEQLGLH